MASQLKELCLQLNKDRVKQYEQELDREIKLLLDTEIIPLLIARKNNIKVDNVISSTLLYCLGLTDQEPVGPVEMTGGSMPDIDVDFEQDRRGEVIQYCIDKYGEECVGGIGTFNFQKAKSVVKNVARTLGYDYEVGDNISKLLLDPISGKTQSLQSSIEQVPEIKQMQDTPGDERTVIKWSLRLEDTIKSVGQHASGYVIANEPLYKRIPTFSKDGFPVAQWGMNEVEDAGLVKFDFLGVAALDKIHRAIDLIKKRHGIDIDVHNLPLDDEKTFKMLRAGDVLGVFQLEGSGVIRDTTVRIQPDRFDDLVVINALCRPGPLASGYLDTYINRKNGTEEVEYLVPAMEPILKDTYGVMAYQEQLMRITRDCCGFTMAESDVARKGVAKKKEKVLKELKPKFINGWVGHGHPKEKGEKLWGDILNCSSYLFNKSHSSGYSLITYCTAYLKANYPAELMCAVMAKDANDRDQMIRYFVECNRMNIRIRPPDVNQSGEEFTLNSKGDVIFGLTSIKNVGATGKHIAAERDNGEFTSLTDFCQRMKSRTNRKKVESLIRAGAFDNLSDRASSLRMLDNIWDFDTEVKKYEKKLATYGKRIAAYEKRKLEIEEGAKKQMLKPPKKPEEPRLADPSDIRPLNEDEILADEKDLLGMYVSSHPLIRYQEAGMLSRYRCTASSILGLDNKEEVDLLLLISNVQELTTRKKKKMAFLFFEDLTGNIEGVVFPNQFDKLKHLIKKDTVVEVSATAEVEVVDMQRIVKLIIRSIKVPPKINKAFNKPVALSTEADNLLDIVEIMRKRQGLDYKVHLAAKLKSGDMVKFALKQGIVGPRGTFLKEVARLNEGRRAD